MHPSDVGPVGPPGFRVIQRPGDASLGIDLLLCARACWQGVSLGAGVLAGQRCGTTFAASLYEGREEAVADRYTLKRLGAPPDVAGAVAFLVSGDAAWITGHTLVVDGGLILGGGV